MHVCLPTYLPIIYQSPVNYLFINYLCIYNVGIYVSMYMSTYIFANYKSLSSNQYNMFYNTKGPMSERLRPSYHKYLEVVELDQSAHESDFINSQCLAL